MQSLSISATGMLAQEMNVQILANNIAKSWAIYLREVGTDQWHQRAVSGLPLYNDYIEAPADVWLAPGQELESDPLRVTVP